MAIVLPTLIRFGGKFELMNPRQAKRSKDSPFGCIREKFKGEFNGTTGGTSQSSGGNGNVLSETKAKKRKRGRKRMIRKFELNETQIKLY